MSMLTPTGSSSYSNSSNSPKTGFWEGQRLAKLRAYEKQAKKKKIKLQDLAQFTQQLGSMLQAGLPLISALDALQEQTSNPVFQIIIRNVRLDITGGTSFSDAVKKYPNAFPNLFSSMVEAGEASGALAEIMEKVSGYFEESVKLTKKVKSAMAYPIAVISLAIILVNVLLIFVIPVFADMFKDFGAELPLPTQLLISTSNFLKSNIVYIIAGIIIIWSILSRLLKTPNGKILKDRLVLVIPIVGQLSQKINLSRFCRTFAVLTRSGVPILRCLEICGTASDNTFILDASNDIARQVSQGGQISDVIATNAYFPTMIKHMMRAGEQTGNIDGMMHKIADFYDVEINNTVAALTSLLEPILIVFLGMVVGGIVMAMFLPIFQLSSVAGRN